MREIFEQPLFGVFITLAAFFTGVRLKGRIKNPLFNPTLFAILVIVGLLLTLGLDYESYYQGGGIIGFFLGPATVALALPIYRQMEKLKEKAGIVLASISLGSLVGIISGVAIAGFLGGSRDVMLTLAPKSVTTPIAIEVSRAIGGVPPLTVSMVIIAGLLGAALGPEILRWIGVKDPVAMGLAMGTASHGLGTARAVQEGETQGAFSGLAIGVAGIVTTLLAPILLQFF